MDLKNQAGFVMTIPVMVYFLMHIAIHNLDQEAFFTSNEVGYHTFIFFFLIRQKEI